MELGVQEIITKLKKLRQKYKTVKDNKKKSGNSKGREWKFFKKMDSILSTRHNVQPPAIVDTMVSTMVSTAVKILFVLNNLY